MHCAYCSSANHRSIDPRIQSALEYIEKQLREDSAKLRLEALAKAVGMSRYHFHRLFKRALGISPREHLMRRRIERAKVLIRERPDLTLCQIASRVGCTDQSHFCRLFQKREGITAGDYKRTKKMPKEHECARR